MAWQDIEDDEIDAGSPITEPLMHKLIDRDEYVREVAEGNVAQVDATQAIAWTMYAFNN